MPIGETMLDVLLHNSRQVVDGTAKIYGVVPAVVTSVHDKDQQRHMRGMVQVFFPWLQAQNDPGLINPWARVCMPTAGKDAGLYGVPQVGDEVLVGFEHGDIHFPYVLGSLWNGKDTIPAPTTPADGEDLKGHDKNPPIHKTPDLKPDSVAGGKGVNKVYFWRSRTGHLVILDDKNGHVRIADATGKSVIQLEKDAIRVLERAKDIYVYAAKLIRFDCENFEVHASKNITMQAGQDWGVHSGQHSTMEAGGTFAATANAGAATNGCSGIVFQSKKDVNIAATMNANFEAGMKVLIKAGKDVKCEAGMKGQFSSKLDFNVKSSAKANLKGIMGVNIGSLGDINVKAGGQINAKGMVINLN